jgi:preprotein translocase subunit SecY
MKVQEGSKGIAELFHKVYQDFQTLKTHTLRKLLLLLVVIVVVVVVVVVVFFHNVC